MALESLNSCINVKDLALEFQKRDDTIGLINSEDLAQVNDKLRFYKLLKKWRKFRALAVAVEWVSPGNYSTLGFGFSDDVWKGMSRIIDSDLSRRNVSAFATTLMETTILFPQKTKEITSNMPICEMIAARIAYNIDKSQWLQLADILFNVKIIKSAKLAEIEINIDNEEAALKGMRGELNACRHEPLLFVRSAVKVKVLFPEAAFSFQIKNLLWEKIKDSKNRLDWRRFGHLAANMTILNANKVTITNGSLKIEPKQSETFNQDRLPLPLQRMFL